MTTPCITTTRTNIKLQCEVSQSITQPTFLSQFGLSLLHCANDHIADCGGWKSVQSALDPTDGDDVQIFSTYNQPATLRYNVSWVETWQELARKHIPVLSAQLMTAPTGRPREIRNFEPDAPPRPAITGDGPCGKVTLFQRSTYLVSTWWSFEEDDGQRKRMINVEEFSGNENPDLPKLRLCGSASPHVKPILRRQFASPRLLQTCRYIDALIAVTYHVLASALRAA